jgi:hypothetical protein
VRRSLDAGRSRRRQEPSAVAVPRARGPWAGRPGCAHRLRVSRPARRPAGDRKLWSAARSGRLRRRARGPERDAGRVERGGLLLSERNREPGEWRSCSDSRRMSRGTDVFSSAIRRARDPEARPSEECPPRRCARPPRAPSRSGSRSRKSRSRSRRATPTTSSRWIAQTGDEVHTYERLCGAGSTSTSSSCSAARCTSSRARSTPRLPGRARLAAPLLAAADRDVGAGRRAGHAHARQAGCRSACRSWGRPRARSF